MKILDEIRLIEVSLFYKLKQPPRRILTKTLHTNLAYQPPSLREMAILLGRVPIV